MTTTTDLPPLRRPGLRAWGLMTLSEARMVWRDTGSIVVPLGLPLIILVMNGLNADRDPVEGLGGLSPFDAIIVPITIVMVLGMVGLLTMPAFLATYRRAGTLRRLSVTPASPLMVLVAQVVVSLALTAVGVALALGVARVAFDLVPPTTALVAGGVLALGCAAIYAVGMVVAAIAPSPNGAVTIGLVTFFAMLILAGGFGPIDAFPGWAQTFGGLLPMGAAREALTAAWVGETPDAGSLLALMGTTVVASAVAVRLFRWD